MKTKRTPTQTYVEALTPREGKVLRYIASTDEQPVEYGRVINHIEWSDLPHSIIEAKAAFDALAELGLIKRHGTLLGFKITPKGGSVVDFANENKLWQQPPPPEVTGISTFKPDASKSKKPKSKAKKTPKAAKKTKTNKKGSK